MVTYKIIVQGLVQGIGYRPFVAELAERCSIGGWVRNTDGIVTILASADASAMELFLGKLKSESPKGAYVEELSWEELPYQPFSGFFIAGSEKQEKHKGIPLIPADLATCEACLRELHDADNRRYRHPFISCTACGPRYSIIEKLPYDRETISMKRFPMCEACESEYKKQGDVRRHAQTIACPDCGPVLTFTQIAPWGEKTQKPAEKKEPGHAAAAVGVFRHSRSGCGETALTRAVQCLREGGIVAVKDIGGYHLACTPFSGNAVQQLRLLKGREKKPFAVMFPDLAAIKEYCRVNREEEAILFSASRPIVLLKKRKDGKRLAENVGGSSPDIGAMLPCNPLQTLLAEALGPLIMTSANASGDLLILENDTMISWMERRVHALAKALPCCGVLSHDRPILTPLDDSIVRVVSGRTQIFRRARGFVPNPVPVNTDKHIFAAGGDLKACFCYTGEKKAYLSQHLGDLEEEGCYNAYQKEIGRMKQLFGFAPEYVACDMHPGYLSARELPRSRTATGNEMQEAKAPEGAGLPPDGHRIYPVQHHEAHVASVIAEHHLTGAVLGFAFDGTGYGRDKTVWGSEVFFWNGAFMRRVAHLRPVQLIGGDEGAKNADTILYGYMASFGEETKQRLWAVGKQMPWLDEQRSGVVEKAVQCRIHTIKSSSMGRLFDAVSAFLDVCHYNSYEGEAAIEVENLAATARRGYKLTIEIVPGAAPSGADATVEFSGADAVEYAGDTESLFLGMADALAQGVPRAEIARGFMDAVSDFICRICDCIAEDYDKKAAGTDWAEERCGSLGKASGAVRQIALSGGTFQNRILLERTLACLEERGYEVYINEQVPPGDGGLCLGQAYLCDVQC